MTDARDVDHLAVYGTLVPGGTNAHVLAGIPGEWTRGTVVGTRHEDGWHGYPGLVLDAAGPVSVHVLRAARLEEHLPRLDDFEGAGYRRVTTSVLLEDGATVHAWVYELAEPPA